MNATTMVLRPTPLITPEQLALEAKARELWEHPSVKAAMAKVKALMLAGYGIDIPPGAKDRYDAAMDEYGFSYVERVLCRDRNNFCVHYTCHPPYTRSDGLHVPGCRFYGENPDAVYRWGGIDPDRSYRLLCTSGGPDPESASFTMMGTYGGTTPTDAINLHQIEREADGSFVLTIDSRPAEGRRNHLQMSPKTRLLLIREFLGDWATQTPFRMTLEADGVQRGGPWDVDAALDDICYFMVEELYLYFWMNHLYRNLAENSVKGPASANAMGGSASMATAQGLFHLEDDDAVIVEWDPADSKLSNISLCDWWFQPIEAHRMQSSLNNRVAIPNGDGTITAVLSLRDPGIANWLEPGSVRDIFLNARWQDVPSNPPREGPKLRTRMAKMADLEAQLPSDLARCSREERSARNAARLAAYTRRTGDPASSFVNID